MPRLPLLLLFLLSAPALRAQVVTTDPSFPTETGPVTIYFDATQGTGGLQGYTGDVYAHTGVITDRSTSPSDWKYVKTSWGQNTAETRLERVGTDRYRLVISDPRAYYGVPPGEQIRQLAFVFRSAAAPFREGKETGGGDIFVTVYQAGLSVRIAEPAGHSLREPLLVRRDTTLRVVAVAGGAPEGTFDLKLYVDGAEVGQTGDDTLAYDLVLDRPGRRVVEAVATSSGTVPEQDTAAFAVIFQPPVADAPLPAGFRDGINYHEGDPTRVTLALFAPRKEHVYLIGDFNDWALDPAYLLRRDSLRADSVRWWITLDGLEPGREYAFQYLVDGEIRTADPYAEKILDPWNDAEVRRLVDPSLKEYPAGLTEHIVSVFRTGREPFDWQVEEFERPAQQDLVIYEMILRDFVAAHRYQTLADTLDYLQRLGVNAIELMPVQEFEGNLSWGYNPMFYFAPDKYYGSADELRRFVDEAHRRGMAVILDVVYNHQTGQSPFARLYNDGDFGPPTPDNPWLNREARHPFNVFYDANHESLLTQALLDRANAYWLTEFGVDGFRFDLSKGFTQKPTTDVGAWSAYDASRIRLLKRMADRIWSVDPDAYVILEHFAEAREERELAAHGKERGLPGMMFWNNMNRAYSQSAMGYVLATDFSSDLTCAYPAACGYPVENRIAYMESHDEQWLMYRNRAYGAENGGYDVKELRTALDRMKLAGAFFFTLPGPKMIWQFGELGYGYGDRGEQCLKDGGGNGECPAFAPGRVDAKPIRWDYRSDPLRLKLYGAWSALLRLRNEHELFRSPETQVDLQVGRREDRRIRLSHPTMNVVVIGNFGLTGRAVTPAFHAPGRWYRFFEGDSVEVADVNEPVTLLPGEFHIYTSRRVEPPEAGLITVDTEPDGGEAPLRFGLDQNYPNPFNPQTTIRFTLDHTGPVSLAVYDLAGRRVAVLVRGTLPAGDHAARFDAAQLPSGLYLYRLEAAGRTETRKMVLVR